MMKFAKSIIKLTILAIALMSTSVSYAQWGEFFGGLFQAAAERWIDNTGSLPSSQDKENARTLLNAFSNEINANQNAANATRDAYNGDYSMALIQGTQAVLNAAGNHSYDTYLNSANTIGQANREYVQNLNNGMDRDVALRKRDSIVYNSGAESLVEYESRVAQKRIQQARQQREAERQSWESNNYFEASSNIETDARTATSDSNVLGSALIAHISTAAVLDVLPDKFMAEKELEKYYGELQRQLQSMAQEYQIKLQSYEANQATMSELTKQSKEKEIVDLQNRIQQFQANAESGFEAKRVELLTPILNKIQNAINAVASENDLTYVIDTSTGAAIFLGEDAIDITYMVMKRLGI